MLTVSIQINGQPIYARTAINSGCGGPGKIRYEIDDGNTIFHNPDDGAIKLAHEMLDLIKVEHD